ncbi:MAG: hypothetical protein RBS40_03365 [Rhodocyclaceae bacterium]|jgi:hypothetical protein|nr:hypothetical protein [Rhodocyclaceae bacterium]
MHGFFVFLEVVVRHFVAGGTELQVVGGIHALVEAGQGQHATAGQDQGHQQGVAAGPVGDECP